LLKNHFSLKLFNFPEKSLQKLNEELINKIKYLSHVNSSLFSIFRMIEQIKEEHGHIKNIMNSLLIKKYIYNNTQFFGLQGYLPSYKTQHILHLFKKGLISLSITEPKKSDNVPVLLSNTRFVKSFEVIVKMFSGVSYHEKDITFIVSFLFICFGVLCFLDGGYGFLLLILGWVLVENDVADYGSIFMFTGFFTSLFGIINGQIFGLIVGEHIFKNSAPLLSLAIDPFYCLSFSLLVGLISSGGGHLTKLWQDGLRTNSSGGLALVMACLLYVLFTSLKASLYFKYFITFLMISIVIILWSMYPEATFGKNQALANIAWTIYNGFVGLIQDVLSHMRLFGISLSGAILALVVNQISVLFPIYIQIPFCVIGHIFVFVLSLVSLCVHTNRLIFLEFGSKCINGGKNYYSPLAGVKI